MAKDDAQKMSLKGSLDLSQIPAAEFSADTELQVAVVRDGETLGHTVVKATKPTERLPFEVEFAVPVLPGARLPCPVRLLVGPNVAMMAALGPDAVSIEVDLAAMQSGAGARRAAKAPALSLERIVVPPEFYLRWIHWCRTYVIRGRVVCRQWVYNPQTGRWEICDSPVPGATVEAYDVDRFLFWYRRDLIKSATTDAAGNFVIKFRWCCWWPIPWPPVRQPGWTLDPAVLDKLRHLFEQRNIPLPPVPPEPDPLFLQALAGGALNALPAVQRPAALPNLTDAHAVHETLRAVLPGDFDLGSRVIFPPNQLNDCAPDIVFRVTQPCDGKVNVIYSETNAQTRWDIPTSLNVTLVANALACCIPHCHDPECPECIVVESIACTPKAVIGDSAGPPDLRGYAYAGTSLDRPFAGALPFHGGVGWDVDYLGVQASFNGGAFTDLATPVFAGYGRSYWNGAAWIGVNFPVVVKSGRSVIMTRKHFEDLNPAIPRFGGAVLWNDYTTLFVWDTYDTSVTPHVARIPDGLYAFRFVGYDANAADDLVLATARVLPTCGQQRDDITYVRLDNRSMALHLVPGIPCTAVHACNAEPDCYIRSICVNEGLPTAHCIQPCDIISLTDNDTLTIHFTASCPSTATDGHLGGYQMNAFYGASQTFAIGTGMHGSFQADPTFEVGPDYASALLQGAPRPHWYGGDYKVTLKGSDFPLCCAYLIELFAWKRTTDGCSDPMWVHNNRYQVTLTVLRVNADGKPICAELAKAAA
jgi:hypothetical protein